MLPILDFSISADRDRFESLLDRLRLDARSLFSGELRTAENVVRSIIEDVANRGVDALVETARKFDDPSFDASKLRVGVDEMRDARDRVDRSTRAALERSIEQVREYQSHVMPASIAPRRRGGLELGLRYTPLDSAGLYVPGGKASYPSSLIMLAVPAQVAGVKRIVVCTPPSKYGKSDLLLAAAAELGIDEMYRIGGAGAIAAMALGVGVGNAVDKIVGPGNLYVQLAKRLLAGAVGIDGFYGPSEIVVIADDSCVPAFVASDLLAQAEHDPGRCFLLTDSPDVARAVSEEIAKQLTTLDRHEAIERSLASDSAAIVCGSIEESIELANRLAGEHVNLQVRDASAAMKQLRHAGAIFVGPHSPVAAGDYLAGPSHSLPTNTTARFGGGISVFEFLKRSGIVRYDLASLEADAPFIESLARAEGLDAHAKSVSGRGQRSV